MADTRLDQAIQKYEEAINSLTSKLNTYKDKLEKRGKKLSEEDEQVLAQEILKVLVTRDIVQAAIIENTQPDDLASSIATVKKLDTSLKEQAKLINCVIGLAHLRDIIKGPEREWWWLLAPNTPKHWYDSLDPLWIFLSILFNAISLTLIGDIATRFSGGDPNQLGSIVLVLSTLATLLSAGGALTKPGHEIIKDFLQFWGFDKRWWDELIVGLSFVLFLVFLCTRLNLAFISNIYTSVGDKAYAQQLATAEDNYNLAINLNPDNTNAHYKLGKIYAETQDFDKALASYKTAVKDPQMAIVVAGDLANLYLEQNDYSKADKWLWKALEREREKRKEIQEGKVDQSYKINEQQYKILEKLARFYLFNNDYANAFRWLSLGLGGTEYDPKKQYILLTYMGWIRVKQERYSEAEIPLIRATSLFKEQPATAHCLLAQAWEKSEQAKVRQQARQEWEQCLRYANQEIPEEDNWLAIARQRLKTQGD
ncbi:MAG TPA: hypothetical protein DCL61_08965 [Cyanobacteria bacterium UBA12227]|nr:hypothetical protein [Cyanobacteria bacterium UBA12227]HAX87652.1 hypothetical protein [Cyanobacteria bacterium UBA11370]HBY77342.1 hypothetical protein [Cyanobacteria bacterium UBA11148]